jgi:hypothetical protein
MDELDVVPLETHLSVDGQTFVKSLRGKSLIRQSGRAEAAQTEVASASSRGTNVKRKRVPAVAHSKSRHKTLDKRKEEYCMFFLRSGWCDKGLSCVYIHDQDKVRVCRKFLNGCCEDKHCQLQHRIVPELMPTCSFFLRGNCADGDACVYSHVAVNRRAAVCDDFVRGYCPRGITCPQKHVFLKEQKPNDTSKKEASDDLPIPDEEIDDQQQAATDTTAQQSSALHIAPRLQTLDWEL